MERVLEVWSSDEYVDAPPLMRVVLEAADIEQIVKMHRVASEHDLDSVAVYCCLPEYGYAKNDDTRSGEFESVEERQASDERVEGWRTECDEMVVTKSGNVYWQAYEKWSQTRFTSEWLTVDSLKDEAECPGPEVSAAAGLASGSLVVAALSAPANG